MDFLDAPAAHRQSAATVRMDWGLVGARAIGADAALAIVVDVLSFTTTTTVALDAGAAVIPLPWKDDRAEAVAREHGALLAVGRSRAGAGQVSLSPASMHAHARAGQRIVLPSPNGATIAHDLATSGAVVVAACLRNARAVGAWVTRVGRGPVAVVAAGERWPDGSLRPAVEDLWGAGAVLAALELRDFSPEAEAARAAWLGVGSNLAAALHDCGSGRELDAIGFGADVDVAAEVDVTSVVPVLRDGVFVDAAATLAP